MKQFNVMPRIGKARHVVNFHDGIKTHSDGSPFFDIRICGNQRALAKFVKNLKATGYSER